MSVALGARAENAWRVSEQEADLVRRGAPADIAEIAADPQRIRIDLKRTAMIVIDMQNDFCTPTTSPDYCREATLYNVKQCFGFVTQSASLEAARPP